MLALSVYPPWAAMLVAGVKKMEVRNWTFTGLLPSACAIYSTHGMDDATVKEFARDRGLQSELHRAGYSKLSSIPRGKILGVVIFTHSGTYEDYAHHGQVSMATVKRYLSPVASEYGWYVGMAMKFQNPIAVHGSPGLWHWKEPASVTDLVKRLWVEHRERR